MTEVLTPSESAVAAARPLCVDLDGTLVKSDTLVDSLLVLLRTRPLRALALPWKLLKGRAAFKAYVTDQVTLDVPHLPYNKPLLKFLQQERARGRKIYLATGADTRLAERVAAHLGIFTGVLGSDGSTNLTGHKKLDRLKAHLGTESFDYVGNATPDLPLLAHSGQAYVANPSVGLRLRLWRRHIQPARTFIERSNYLRSLVKAVRPHQWAKNLLIFLPVFLSHRPTPHRMMYAAMAFGCFCLAASGNYILNDLLDIEADRRHPRKRARPFASGDFPAFIGFAVAVLFLAASLVGGQLLPVRFYKWLLFYLATTIAYSSFLKRFAIVDVVVLAGLYTLRIQAGGAATHTPVSHWLAGFSIFLFLSLAIVKRFSELQNIRSSGAPPKNGRGYLVADIEQIRAFGTASAFASVVIFANYISGHDVVKLYHQPRYLWAIMPFMILWLSRVWLLASRGELNEDPVIFALTDRMSLLMGVAVVVVACLAL